MRKEKEEELKLCTARIRFLFYFPFFVDAACMRHRTAESIAANEEKKLRLVAAVAAAKEGSSAPSWPLASCALTAPTYISFPLNS